MALEAGIVIGGVTYAVQHPVKGTTLPIVTWRGVSPNALEFTAGQGANRVRSTAINVCVWHWTGGEGDAAAVARTLVRRGLGIHFVIDRDGRIYQHCDPIMVACAHAGSSNARSVGVEIVSYGYAGGWAWDPLRALRVPLVPRRGRDRETYDATTHSRTVKTAHFYPAQTLAAVGLATALSEALGIPREVASESGVLPPMLLAGDARFRGHLGHYHVSEKKRDPGPALMDALRMHFARTRAAGSLSLLRAPPPRGGGIA
jgi:N-acetyl-anhydromuramyl-L-alanine amidase AmpD